MDPREYTEEEVRDQFMNHVRHLVKYWATVDGQKTVEDRISGFAHSLLATIDGCSTGLPGFILAPIPHEDDKQYHIDNEENWYPENHQVVVRCDIAGGLHEILYKK